MTFWDSWHCRDRGEASVTFSSLTVTSSQQNSPPISTRTSITAQISLHAQAGLQSSFGGAWAQLTCICVYVPTSCLYVGSFYSYLFFCFVCCCWYLHKHKLTFWELTRLCLGEVGVGTIVRNYPPDACCTRRTHSHTHTHTQRIALLFYYLIISCSNYQNGKRAAAEMCASWVHNACNKYACKSLSILILSQPCSPTSCTWLFINMFSLIPPNHSLYRVACREEDSVTLCPPLILCHCSGSLSGQSNKTCSIIQALDWRVGTHMSYTMRDHMNTKLQPGAHSSSSAIDG